MYRRSLLSLLAVLALMAAACGSDSGDDADAATDDAGADEAATDQAATDGAATDEAVTDEAATEDSAADAGDEDAPAPAGGTGATITLANGEVFEFSLLCMLEPQEAAGQTIAFTVVSYDDPYNLDITQFDEDSDFAGAAVGIHDSETFETVWEASNIFSDSDLELSLDGSTVTGTGQFYPEGDIAADPVEGDIVANC